MTDELRWKGVVAYDGTDWYGWQRQPYGNTIQNCLEERLSLLLKRRIDIHGSGRTDAGVHALAQVFHFSADWKHGAEPFLKALNAGLPESILVRSIEPVPAKFHARYSACGKRYTYSIHQGIALPTEVRTTWVLDQRHQPLDYDAMRAAADLFVGTHDFSAFSANRRKYGQKNGIKTLHLIAIEAEDSRVKLVYEGEGFLYKMARTLTGALVQVGLGRLTSQEILELLRGKQRSYLTPSAPARGLTLEEVFYQWPEHWSIMYGQ